MNVQDLRNLNPCYDPTKYLPEDWEGELIDVLEAEVIPEKDRLLVFCKAATEEQADVFARWCALQVVHLWGAPKVVKEFLETGDKRLRDAEWAMETDKQLNKAIELLKEEK